MALLAVTDGQGRAIAERQYLQLQMVQILHVLDWMADHSGSPIAKCCRLKFGKRQSVPNCISQVEQNWVRPTGGRGSLDVRRASLDTSATVRAMCHGAVEASSNPIGQDGPDIWAVAVRVPARAMRPMCTQPAGQP